MTSYLQLSGNVLTEDYLMSRYVKMCMKSSWNSSIKRIAMIAFRIFNMPEIYMRFSSRVWIALRTRLYFSTSSSTWYFNTTVWTRTSYLYFVCYSEFHELARRSRISMSGRMGGWQPTSWNAFMLITQAYHVFNKTRTLLSRLKPRIISGWLWGFLTAVTAKNTFFGGL
jgi:hypothetical protein